MFYRLYQFYSALFPRITAEEKNYVNNLLINNEHELFEKLQASDQKHALRIAKHLNNIYPDDLLLQKAALLHDIGKTFKPLNPIEKILTVILDKYYPDFAKKLSRKENSIMDIYYNHAEKGAQLAESLAINKEIVFLIRHHHNNKIADAKLQALIAADNLY